ncbi:MAG: DUF4810 domain-containing protein [Herminiimonas sp.]|nr:DUF4810 domain-containing protein [Herminiimonas sp.]
MMQIQKLIFAFALPLFLAACVAAPKYTWGNYDRSLYNYYKDTSNSASHVAELEKIIQTAEQTKGRVPPGIHAEYGYFLLRSAKGAEAVTQFENEKRLWPESTLLMNIMIKSAQATPVKPVASKE